MKKYFFLLATVACAFLAQALPSYLEFSTVGPDRYADGSLVLEREMYACVWVKDGAEFAGLTVQGELVDPVNNRLIACAPLATKNSNCPKVFVLLEGELANLENGSFRMFVLDTRVRKADGAVSLANDESFVAVRSYASASDVTIQEDGKTVVKSSAPIAGAYQSSVAPVDAPKPIVKSIEVYGSQVILTVGQTVPYLTYSISSGDTPKNLQKNELMKSVNGTVDGELKLILPDAKTHRFFQVIRD